MRPGSTNSIHIFKIRKSVGNDKQEHSMVSIKKKQMNQTIRTTILEAGSSNGCTPDMKLLQGPETKGCQYGSAQDCVSDVHGEHFLLNALSDSLVRHVLQTCVINVPSSSLQTAHLM